MPSLSQLLAIHRSALVFDAASTRIQVGLLHADTNAVWHDVESEAGSAIFSLTEKILGDTSLKLADIGTFIFCEGPGSMLGVRTVAMALRTWQTLAPRPAYSYQSLAVAAQLEWTKCAPRKFAVIADARRESWHLQIVNADGTIAPLARVAASALPDCELVTPENFRRWSTLPPRARAVSYRLAEIFPALNDGNYFKASPTPDVFQHEAPEYKKWSAQMHSAATAPQK